MPQINTKKRDTVPYAKAILHKNFLKMCWRHFIRNVSMTDYVIQPVLKNTKTHFKINKDSAGADVGSQGRPASAGRWNGGGDRTQKFENILKRVLEKIGGGTKIHFSLCSANMD